MNETTNKTTLLRRLRLKSGYLTTTKFAEELGLNTRTVNAHELGTRPINEKYAKVYAKALSIEDWSILITKEEVDPRLLFSSFSKEMEVIIYVSTILSEIKNIDIKTRMKVIKSFTTDKFIANKYYNKELNKEIVIKECINIIKLLNQSS